MTHASMPLGVVVAAAADVAGAGAAAEDAAAVVRVALDVEAAAAELGDVAVVVAHTRPPMDSSPAVAAVAALQTQVSYPTLVAAGFAVDPDSVQAEPHTRDTPRTAAEAGRTDYAGVASGEGQVDASRREQAVHTGQAGVVGKVDEAAAIPSVRGTNSRKGLAARELGVVRSGVGSHLGMMWMGLLWEGEEQGWRIVGAGARG